MNEKAIYAKEGEKAVKKITPTVVNKSNRIQEAAVSAQSMFKNSKQYKRFNLLAGVCSSLARNILDAQNAGLDNVTIDMSRNDTKMTVIWGGTLAVLLARLRKSLFRVDKLSCSVEDRIKRLCVYYMCIDDLPL